ncbi:MAG TPA: hypothetical protein VNQ73_14350 [Ilumatobacter sp.]|nr:hypothetical protein [Ilumatobacter sp.]
MSAVGDVSGGTGVPPGVGEGVTIAGLWALVDELNAINSRRRIALAQLRVQYEGASALGLIEGGAS